MTDKTPEALSPEVLSSPSSPSTEIKTDYMSSYTQIESSTYNEQSQITDLSSPSSSVDENAPEMDDDNSDNNKIENALPELSSQIIEWSKERFESYDQTATPIDAQNTTNETKKTHLPPRSISLFKDDSFSLSKNIELNHVNEQILKDIEKYSLKLSNNVNQIMGFIKMTSNEITENSVRSIQTFQDTQNDLCMNVDANIKLMYKVISKCEELDKSMSFAEDLATKIRTIRQTVESFEKLLQA